MTTHTIVTAVVCLATCGQADIAVWDGDSFTMNREKFRLEEIDTPEIGDRARCAYEARLAERAKARFVEILGSGEPVVMAASRPEKYHRTLVRIVVGGKDVGELLIADGLARPWEGRRQAWCP